MHSAMHSAACAMVCPLSICPDVCHVLTFMYCIETNKHILKLFHHHSSFPYETLL